MNKLWYGIITGIVFITISVLILSVAIITTPRLDDGSREKNIIRDLLYKGYTFILPRDYFNGTDYSNQKIAMLIHDADFSNTGQQKFMQIENGFGIRSAFYPRPDTEWFSQNAAAYQDAEKQGWEIGYQYDCLSRTEGNKTVAYQLFQGQLSYMRTLFNISTTDYHGDNYNISILNLDLYNETLWHSLGLNEVYKIQNYSYYTDTNNALITPSVLKNLVIIQLHTDWTK